MEQVSKLEFRKAMPMIGLDVPLDEIDKLFDEWDPDGSGTIEMRELNKFLRRGGEVQLDAKMQTGAAGEIKVKAENKSALRRGVSLKSGLAKPALSALSGF